MNFSVGFKPRENIGGTLSPTGIQTTMTDGAQMRIDLGSDPLSTQFSIGTAQGAIQQPAINQLNSGRAAADFTPTNQLD